jgi:adhesin transport system membrane fusion protein
MHRRVMPGLMFTLALGFGLFLVWAWYFQLDQSVRAQGQLVPDTRTQVIQSADGGVLEKILVSEGQSVKAGQVLATLEQERASAGVDEGRAKVASLQAALFRARAEANGEALDFGRRFREYPEIVREQTALFEQKRKGLMAELAVLDESLELARDELRVNENLSQTGDISRLELLRARRQVAELVGKIEGTRNKYLQDARQEVTRLQEEATSNQFKLEERRSLLNHTNLVSPVDGVVKILRINTVGGVLKAGDELMQISPTDVDLLAEIKILPADVGQLDLSMPATVKVDAFDYSIYGSLQGRLEYLSSDTLTEQGANNQVQTFYRARVRVDAKSINPKLPLSQLKSGMTVSVDIQTGSRSVLHYVLKPITKALQGAGTER